MSRRSFLTAITVAIAAPALAIAASPRVNSFQEPGWYYSPDGDTWRRREPRIEGNSVIHLDAGFWRHVGKRVDMARGWVMIEARPR